MDEEELIRLEHGTPSGIGEAVAAIVFLLAVGGLLTFIVVCIL